MLQFILLVFLGITATEILSYFAHRFLFHGILWRIHRTHHESRTGNFELNDVFSLFFAGVSMSLMIFADKPFINSVSFPLGLGIALFGVFYFIVHDLFTHRRFLPFKSENRFFLKIRRAHQRHHQSVEKHGLEPFGLLLFDYQKYRPKN